MNPRGAIGLFVAVALLLGAVSLWSRLNTLDSIRPLVPEAPAVEPEAPRAELSRPETPATVANSAAREAVDAPTSNAPTTAPACRVLGRVLDARGHVVEGVAVILLMKSMETDALPRARTGNDGRFELVCDRVPDGWFSIVLAPPLWYARAEAPLGEDADGRPRRLVAGDNDLGDVLLRDRGAVDGRVVDEGGLPIAGAVISVASKSDVTGLQEVTDEHGRFVLGGLPEGKIGLRVVADGWLATNVNGMVIVRETRHLDDVVLVRAPSISGVVVDEAGSPARGVELRARTRGGFGPAAMSGEDGSFTLFFDSVAPHWIQVPATEEYDSYGVLHPETATLFEPGTTGVRVVLRRATSVTFRVVDAATHSPIERFGLRVVREPGPKSPTRATPSSTDHPGGVVRASATVDVSWVHVWSDDHAPFESKVTLDAGSTDTQTIALRKGATIVGRVAPGDHPIEGVQVAVWREAFRKDGSVVQDLLANEPGATFDVPAIAESTKPRSVLADGAFEFANLLAGTYALSLQDHDGTRTYVRSLRVVEGHVLDVGEVSRVRGATVTGRLVAPGDETPKGFTVLLSIDAPTGSTGNRLQVLNDLDGRFSFAGLEAGDYSIAWIRPENAGANKQPGTTNAIRFTLAAGETREIVLDASGSSPCRVDVRVLRGGEPMAGVSIVARIVASDGTVPQKPSGAAGRDWIAYSATRYLGTTDAEGRVSRTIEGGLSFTLSAMGEGKRTIARSDTIYASVPRGHVECTLEARVGTVVLEIPTTCPPVADGSVSIAMQRGDGESASFWLTSPTASFRRDGDPLWTIGRNVLGQVPIGDYDVTVTFQRMVTDRDSPKGSRMDPVRAPLRTKVAVAEGAEARIVVP